MALGPVVCIDGLVRHYGRVEAVNGIDLEVQRREVFGSSNPTARARAP